MTDGVRALFEFLFKYRPAVFEHGDLALGARWPWVVVVLIGAALAAVALRSYASARGSSSRRDRIVLRALRVAILVALVTCLLRPMLIVNAAVAQRNFVGVLIDDSRSMQIADERGRTRAAVLQATMRDEQGALLTSLRERFQVRLFRFGATVERVDSASALTFAQHETRLADALEGARRELESVPLSGLVLLSDGADNAKVPIADMLRTLRARSVPVFTVGIGAERFDKDIEVRRVEMARTALKGSTLVADLLVRQRGFPHATVPLLIEDDGRVIGRSQVTLPIGNDAASVRVQVQLTRPGARTLTFRIPLQPNEQVAQNNSQSALVRVRDAKDKILYLEGEPRYEMKFIRNAVEADSNLQLVALQRTAENKFLRLNVDGPTELAGGFPQSRAALFQYRAVIIGNIEASFFTHDQLQMLVDFVGVRGGGLLLLGGRRAFSEGGYAGTVLADIMPVVIEGAAVVGDSGFVTDLAVSLTPSGLGAAVTQVVAESDTAGGVGKRPPTAQEKWASLPAVTSVNRIRGVKPGAVTLIAGRAPAQLRAGTSAPTLSRYEQPVLAAQRYGRGLSVALPIQDSWTWQMHADVPLEDATFERFWRQMLRWLTSDVPGRVTISASTDQVNPRSPVVLRAEVVDSAFQRLNDATVVAHVVNAEGQRRDVPMEWTVDRDGEYQATFTPDGAGTHSIEVRATSREGVTASESSFVRVAELNDEFVDAEMRASLLRRLADETGGRYYTPSDTRSLAADVALSPRGVTVVNEMDLWDMPINFLLLVALLSAEWGFRKLRGLA